MKEDKKIADHFPKFIALVNQMKMWEEEITHQQVVEKVMRTRTP